MDWAILRELEITAMGEALSILKQAKEPSTQTIYAKAPSAKLPQLHFKMIPCNNSESYGLIGKCLPEWQTCQFLRPTSSYSVVLMNPSKMQL